MRQTKKSGDRFAKEPKQTRSRESLERLLTSAAKLLTEKKYSDFTLQEVSKVSNVSIGSIYNRFKGKDDLVRQIQQREVERMDIDSAVMINNLRRQQLPLRQLMPAVVHGFAEFLRKYRGILRALMEIAIVDEVVADTGRKHSVQNIGDYEKLLLECRDEITQPNPERAVNFVFRLVYASLSRYLGLGTVDESLEEGDWETLLDDLSDVSLHYLLGNPDQIRE
ncbi:TetR/AcrR family transcriptional regulator [Aestuariicella hydrocarbonica]|uniref:TetR/AcrR family transcriptional regulator n=1 Tax=Pseudomaricurvus hydrocarbonicus TaxID=1470433 RepID=A0A9E5T3S4_9GAMM|nr:TetR/AcrR family transcriptional regulator [Aestuariicella hydrocarbonica]NHO67382.1 TetR/AcrR family transcriptional regulator [Aestuariicella hydrocarbonica]